MDSENFYDTDMTVLQIRDIEKKDVPLHYRNEYTGVVDFKTNISGEDSARFNCTIERGPTGAVKMSIDIVDNIDYPLLPLIKGLKEKLLELEKKGTYFISVMIGKELYVDRIIVFDE